MRLLKLLPVALLLLLATVTVTQAEQIRLSDGRFLQGEVVEVTEDGFTFKLIETGGQVFLRWNQVDDGLQKRLTQQQDPDEGLNLEVKVPGARLELIDGTVYEGDITRTGGSYRVRNVDYPNGRNILDSEVVDEGFVTDILIDATVMMSEMDALKLAETERAPLTTARQHYELARIADRLGLYTESKGYVSLAMALSPDNALRARLIAYEGELDELIRQAVVLQLLVRVRAEAKKKAYATALSILASIKTDYSPTGAILDRLDATESDIELEFTKYVIDQWYKMLTTVAREKLRHKDSKEITVNEALNWARRQQMDLAIQEKIMGMVGGTDPADIKARFDSRFTLESAKVVRLSIRKASYGESGFYQIVEGHLPVAGKKPDDAATPTPDPRGGRRGPGATGRDGDAVPENDDGFGFQAIDKEVENEIRDLIRRIGGGDAPGEDASSDAPKIGKQDVSKLKVPNVVPPLVEWWDDASLNVRTKWLVAAYVRYSGTMRIVELDRWDIKYK